MNANDVIQMHDNEHIHTHNILHPSSTIVIVLGAHDWKGVGLNVAPSFLRSAKGIVAHCYDTNGLCVDPELVVDLFDAECSADDQLAKIHDFLSTQISMRRCTEKPITDVLVYYVGHGHVDGQGQLALLVRRSRKDLETATGIRPADLALTLRSGAPAARRFIILDCCFSEIATQGFLGLTGDAFNSEAPGGAMGEESGAVETLPNRGTVILCSSPSGDVSVGPPDAAYTQFTGALLDVLQNGSAIPQPYISFVELRNELFKRMKAKDAAVSRPVLHQPQASQGDLVHAPGFLNRRIAPRGIVYDLGQFLHQAFEKMWAETKHASFASPNRAQVASLETAIQHIDLCENCHNHGVIYLNYEYHYDSGEAWYTEECKCVFCGQETSREVDA